MRWDVEWVETKETRQRTWIRYRADRGRPLQSPCMRSRGGPSGSWTRRIESIYNANLSVTANLWLPEQN